MPIDPNKVTDVSWWHSVLEFTREPGAWLLIIVALLGLFWWKFGTQIIEAVSRATNARIATQEAQLAEAKAHAAQAQAEAAKSEAEADKLKNERIRDLETRVTANETKLASQADRIQEHSQNERDCLRRMGEQSEKMVQLQAALVETRHELADKGSALNVAITRLKMAEKGPT